MRYTAHIFALFALFAIALASKKKAKKNLEKVTN
jgi:hypothetical protein